MSNPILALIPSGYNTSKVYSILPNDASGDFDFDRASESTRVRKDGLIEEVANDVPRLDWYNSNCPSLLLEPQRTNLVLYSEQFSGANWITVNTSLTSNTVISPDGTMTANTLQRTSTSASYRGHNISKSASAITYTTSAFVKQGSDNYFSMRAQGSYPQRVDIRFRFDTEEIYYANAVSAFVLLDYGVENYGNGWYRIYFTYTTDTNTQLGITFSPRATDGNIDGSDTSTTSFAYVWGAQTEQGNYRTSYIKTEGSTSTRLKDFISGGGNANLFNSLEGTFFVQMASFLNAQTNSNGIELSDSGGQNRVTVQYDTTNNQIRAEIKLANVTQALLFTTSYDVTNFNKIAVTYKYNEAKLYINGSLISTDTSVNIFAEDTLTEVRSTIAGISSGAFNLQAKIKDLRVYDRVLTDAELTELTTL